MLFNEDAVSSATVDNVTFATLIRLVFVAIEVNAPVVVVFSFLSVVVLALFKSEEVTFVTTLWVAFTSAVVVSVIANVVFVTSDVVCVAANVVSVTIVGRVVSTMATVAPVVPGCVASSYCFI